MPKTGARKCSFEIIAVTEREKGIQGKRGGAVCPRIKSLDISPAKRSRSGQDKNKVATESGGKKNQTADKTTANCGWEERSLLKYHAHQGNCGKSQPGEVIACASSAGVFTKKKRGKEGAPFRIAESTGKREAF